MIFENAYQVITETEFLHLADFIPDAQVFLKLEGLNPAGSVKLKTAIGLIESMEETGIITPHGRVIESSSGNLGIALAMVCSAKDYQLTIVTDPNATRQSIQIMRSLGAEVAQVTTQDARGGFLNTRIDYVGRRLAADPGLVWLNQYANPANVRVHRERTAKAIHRELGRVDALFVGAGTSGTLMGCVEYFIRHSPRTRLVAVDTFGSVTFGGQAARRFIPGLGSSIRSGIYADRGDFEKVVIREAATVAMCRFVAARYGLLTGGSTGTVLAAVRQLAPTLQAGARVAAISPDMGDRYLDTIYDDDWVRQKFGVEALDEVAAPGAAVLARSGYE
jgi:2,3-diaminopropionate biosynthesis protein SbnA